MSALFILYVIITGSIYFYNIGQKQSKLLNVETSSLVKEIILLIENDPDGWEFQHEQEKKDEGYVKTLASWYYKKLNINISMESGAKKVLQIWQPSVIALNDKERNLLTEAFKNKVTYLISKRTTKLLTSVVD